jgi:hypothetical protein
MPKAVTAVAVAEYCAHEFAEAYRKMRQSSLETGSLVNEIIVVHR